MKYKKKMWPIGKIIQNGIIWILHRGGQTFDEIGKQFKISRQRAHQIYNDETKWLQDKPKLSSEFDKIAEELKNDSTNP